MTQLQVSYSFYNHFSSEEGAILRLEDCLGNFGVANIHPLLQLGDLSLSEELRTKGPLYQRAYELALEDLNARKDKKNLYHVHPIQNHILVRDWKAFDTEGFSNNEIYKFKGGLDFIEFAHWLNFHEPKFSKIRIDFNAKLNLSQFEQFIGILNPEVLQKIDVIEDPTQFDYDKWSEFSKQVRIASDFEKMNSLTNSWPVRINKPSREAYDTSSLYMTSSMDHPIGHVHAMRFAQQHPTAKHGFLTINSHAKLEYFLDFAIQKSEIKYNGNGFGIGFDRQLKKENFLPEIDWQLCQESQLILDPNIETEKRHLAFAALKTFKEKHPNDYILLASSGTTTSHDEIKLYAFSKKAFLSAADRVIRHFEIPMNLRWGCVLPFHHVAGLSVLARTFLTKSEFVVSTWRKVNHAWFAEKKIQAISLVPAQVFDIVQNNWSAPSCLKLVFVGAGQLNPEIYQKATLLGWPLRLTYGMTETIGMIAEMKGFSAIDPIYTFMSGVLIKENEPNQVRVSSQAEFKILAREDHIDIEPTSNTDGFMKLPDQIEMIGPDSFKVIGRVDDQIKIKGELVHLAKIKKAFASKYSQNFELLALEDQRSGYQLVMVFEQNDSEQLRLVLQKELNIFNSQLKKFEQIKFFTFISEFPKSSLLKNRIQDIKILIEQNTEKGLIYEIGKF